MRLSVLRLLMMMCSCAKGAAASARLLSCTVWAQQSPETFSLSHVSESLAHAVSMETVCGPESHVTDMRKQMSRTDRH